MSLRIAIPDREVATKMGWTHQVDWVEASLPCFLRCKSEAKAEEHAGWLREKGVETVIVTDLRPHLALH